MTPRSHDARGTPQKADSGGGARSTTRPCDARRCVSRPSGFELRRLRPAREHKTRRRFKLGLPQLWRRGRSGAGDTSRPTESERDPKPVGPTPQTPGWPVHRTSTSTSTLDVDAISGKDATLDASLIVPDQRYTRPGSQAVASAAPSRFARHHEGLIRLPRAPSEMAGPTRRRYRGRAVAGFHLDTRLGLGRGPVMKHQAGAG